VIRAATLLGLAGLALATALFVWQGVGPVLAAFAAGGLGIVWASLFHFVSMAVNAHAWQVLLPAVPRGRRGSLAFYLWAVWLREAVNGLLPVASLVVDMTVSLASQFGFTMLGVALLAALGAGGSLTRGIALGLLAAFPLMAAIVLVQRVGLFTLLARLFRALFGDRFDVLVGGAAPLDRAVRRLYRRRGAIVQCFAWQLIGWVAGAGEVWLALFFLGHPVGFVEAVIVEAVIQALSSGAFVVPGALGVQEGGFLVIGALIGLSPELALALALARRARDIIVFVPALLFWQIAVGRRALG
jgi:uncharacterized membrane protein YbhN (UPF0104 family)